MRTSAKSIKLYFCPAMFTLLEALDKKIIYVNIRTNSEKSNTNANKLLDAMVNSNASLVKMDNISIADCILKAGIWKICINI